MDALHITIADPDPSHIIDFIDILGLRSRSKLKLVHNVTIARDAWEKSNDDERVKLRQRVSTDLISSGEYATIDAMHSYCKGQVLAGRESYVVYFHNKGTYCAKQPPSAVGDWRELMNAFVLEYPSICLRAMTNGYSTYVMYSQ
jgi:hypothetical protein